MMLLKRLNDLIKKVCSFSTTNTGNLVIKTDYKKKLVKLKTKSLLIMLNILQLKNLIKEH